MTTEQWLKMLRRKMADVDTAAQRRTDTELLDNAADLRLELAARQLRGFADITVDSVKSSPTYGILNATDEQGLILVYTVAHSVLNSIYRQRVERGELGVSWSSGLESESSISAEKAYKQLLDDLVRTADELIITYQRQDANARIL